MTSNELSQPNVTVEEASPASYATRTLTVDFLFLDREDCERCSGAEESLRDAIEAVADLLARLGVEIVVRNVHVEDEAAARRTRLEISPTIRIDGRDVQPEYAESACESCGDLCGCGGRCADGDGVSCRVWLYRGEEYTTPPVELIVEALLRGALSARPPANPPQETTDYRLSDDLGRFFGNSPSVSNDAEGGHSSCC